jgi:uncharacterized protein YcbK (DUF882 family)
MNNETFASWFDRQGLKHFKASELEWYFTKKRGRVSNKPPAIELWQNIIPTLRILDRLREETGRAITITSTYRDKPYNRAIGSGDGSQHVQFRAVDFTVAGMSPGMVANKLRAMRDRGEWIGGLGKYPTFCHIDTRAGNASW